MFQIYSFFGVLFFLIQKDKVPPLYFLLPCVATTQKHEGEKSSFVEHKTNKHLHLAVPFAQSKACVGFQREGGFVR